MPGPWEKYQTTESKKPWEKYGESSNAEVLPETPKTSSLEAGARGVQQGLTAGFSDELGGIGSVLGEAAYDILHGESSDYGDTYTRGRDLERSENKKAQEDHGLIYGASSIAGSIPGAIALGGSNLAGSVASGAAQGGLSAVGGSESSDPTQLAKEAALGSIVGGTAGAAGYGLSKVTPALFASKAEQLAENATGATAKQFEKFKPGSGRELLDRKVVTFGSTPKTIAKRASDALDVSGAKIDKALSGFDEQGARISNKQIKEALESKIASIGKDESQIGVKKQLQSIAEEIPEESRSLTDVERVKRGFARNQNYSDQASVTGRKEAAEVYRKLVEQEGEAIDPSLSGVFKEGKKEWGLFAPIEEAAERRSNQLKQMAMGGLLDVGAAGVGGVIGEQEGGHRIKGALAGIALRRGVGPRLASSGAVSLDKIAKMLSAGSEKLGPFAGVLKQAFQRGPQAAAATHFILSSQYPSYREMTDQINNEE